MSWAKLDDQFHAHPKLQRAQKHANAVAGVYARALSYCAAMLTDGWVDGFWASRIASPKEIALTTEVRLWTAVRHGDKFVITDRRDSGRRKLPDVTVLMPTDGFFIEDYLHYNPSRDEVIEKRKRAAGARADVQQIGEQSQPVPSQPVLNAELPAMKSRLGPIDRLMEVLTDGDEGTKAVLSSMALALRLSEGDFEYARECATGPGVRSPTRVAVRELQKRGKVSA